MSQHGIVIAAAAVGEEGDFAARQIIAINLIPLAATNILQKEE